MGSSTVDITGTVQVTTARKDVPLTLMQTITDLECREGEMTVPHAGNAAIPMGFAAGITAALFVMLLSPRKVTVRYTTEDGSHPGPVEMSCKGLHILTLPPGGGITAITVYNVHETEDAVIEYVIGSKSLADDEDPQFFTDSP